MSGYKALGAVLILLIGVTSCGESDTTPTLVVLVSNDDGVGSEGIDQLVEALVAEGTFEVTVSAPATNQSGSSDNVSDEPPPATETTTASGYPAIAVEGFPADAVLHGLNNLFPDGPPDLVVTGLNDGQNVSDFIANEASGTVGAAKTGARNGVPAVALSQGEGDVVDFPAGVAEGVRWINENRAAILAAGTPTQITSINIPSCSEGEIRGRVEVPLMDLNFPLNPTDDQDCTSTLTDPVNDTEAFLNGFVSISKIDI